jgi:type VI secretion system protein ImpG
MDPRLLEAYNRELHYLRDLGGEFAAEFPKVAGRLGIESQECADPYVERLLESFAFLTARIQLKMDAEFPAFTQQLLHMVYPHALAPVPSMAVVQLAPHMAERALLDGFRVQRGAVLRSPCSGSETVCEFRTSHDVVLWPLELVAAEYTAFLADLGVPRLSAKSTLRLRLRCAPGLTIDQLALDRLPLFLRGGDEIAMRLYELAMAHTVGIVTRPEGTATTQVLDQGGVNPVGFDDDQALLPYGPRSFQGYRLLQEYFAFPQRFLSFELTGLGKAVRAAHAAEIELAVVFDQLDPRLEKSVSAAQLALFCTPAVNLFPRRADRMTLDHGANDVHVVPDRTRPMDFEVHSVTEVVGFGSAGESKQDFLPFYATADHVSDGRRAYYTSTRKPRVLSTKQRIQGARSSYLGSEVFLSLVDPEQAPYGSHLRQLAISTLCSNRDLPLRLAVGQGPSDFTLEANAPVLAVRCVAGPTPPRPPCNDGAETWQLISHLSLNYLSLADDSAGGGASALRELLELYGDRADPIIRRQIEGVRAVSSHSIVRRVPLPGPAAFARGTEVILTCDERAFEGLGAFLLGAVLERFFSRYAAISSFCETVLCTVQRGEIMRWPARLGHNPLC